MLIGDRGNTAALSVCSTYYSDLPMICIRHSIFVPQAFKPTVSERSGSWPWVVGLSPYAEASCLLYCGTQDWDIAITPCSQHLQQLHVAVWT